MGLVINANGQNDIKFNNDFLFYYPDYHNYLFLPDRGIVANSGEGPSDLGITFSQNGTPVNSLCQRLETNSLSSTSCTMHLKSIPHNFGGGGTENSYTDEDMGTIRLGDISQFWGGEKFSNLRWRGSISVVFSNSANSKLINPDLTLTMKLGVLHNDGTITYFHTITENIQKTGQFNSFTVWDGETIQKRVFNEISMQYLDRFVFEINGKLNSATYKSGYSSAQAYQTSIDVNFPNSAPFLQLFANE